MHGIRLIPLLVTIMSLTAVPFAQDQSGPSAPSTAPARAAASDRAAGAG